MRSGTTTKKTLGLGKEEKMHMRYQIISNVLSHLTGFFGS